MRTAWLLGTVIAPALPGGSPSLDKMKLRTFALCEPRKRLFQYQLFEVLGLLMAGEGGFLRKNLVE